MCCRLEIKIIILLSYSPFLYFIQAHVYGDLTSSIKEKTSELSGDEDIYRTAECVADKYRTLNSLFSDVHEKVGHAKPVEVHEIRDIGNFIFFIY